MTRLQELGLIDFTGGLNIQRHNFGLAKNESPQMLNMRADRDGGIYTRQGWRRWNATNIVAGDWVPRNGYEQDYSDDSNAVFVTEGTSVHVADGDSSFSEITGTCNAFPHLADFASWGDTTYIATGRKVDEVAGSPMKYEQGGTTTNLTPVGIGSYNNDYTVPVGGVMPQADFVEAHAGYMFAASVKEDESGTVAQNYPSRLRWSHPDSPEDWAELDRLDIEVGGGRITGLQSFQDHLLIFKTDSLWALYGYDSDSWQLIKVSRSIGCPAPTAITRTPSAVFFYSASGRGGIFAYTGGTPIRISENVDEALTSLTSADAGDVFMGWVVDRLLVSVPWIPWWDNEVGAKSSLLAFDPDIGNGAWELHRPAKGNVGPIIERSDSFGELSLVCQFGDGTNSCLLQIGAVEEAVDYIDDQITEIPFRTRYATSWKYANTPELRKHWHRPRYIIRNPQQTNTILVEAYRDYDESNPRRTHQLVVTAGGGYYWRDLGADAPEGDGFDWEPTAQGRGGVWQGETSGSRIVRGKSFGIARSVQVVFSTAPASVGVPWGIDAVILKHIDRRFTT